MVQQNESLYEKARSELLLEFHSLLEVNTHLSKSFKQLINDKQHVTFDEKTRSEYKNFFEQLKNLKEKKSFKASEMPPEFLSKNFSSFVRNMSLVYIITIFERFLGEILRITFKGKPEILKSYQKQISYDELLTYNDFNEILQIIIEKEIRSLFMKDIEEINKYFKDKFNLDLSQFTDWMQFTERFYRRNILIHNKGQINEVYIQKTSYEGKDLKLDVTENYLNRSIKLFYEVSLKVSEHFFTKFNI